MSDWINLFGPVVIILILVLLGFWAQSRQKRNEVLEQWIALGRCGPANSFLGTLVVEEDRPGFLRLAKSTQQAKWLQFQYRWLTGVREQAAWDEAIFDGSRGAIELKRKEKITSLPFSKFCAIRMRELYQGEAGSLWHLELLAVQSKNILFASSARGNRQTGFENTAGLARAISMITSLPVQVVPAGNIWTLGWPPKTL